MSLDPQHVRIIMGARYAMSGSLVVLIYEWLDNLEDEVKMIHRGKWGSMRVLYTLCRYYTMAVWPIIAWAYISDHSYEFCRNWVPALHALLLPFQLLPQLVTAIRAYAFTRHSRVALVILSTCLINLLWIDIWAFWTGAVVLDKFFFDAFGGMGCFTDLTFNRLLVRLGLSMLAATITDAAVLVLILYHELVTRTRDSSLGKVFVGQGIIYFMAIITMNAISAGLCFSPAQDGVGIAMTFVLTPIFACKIILSLRTSASPSETEIMRRNSHIIREAFRTRPGLPSSPTDMSQIPHTDSSISKRSGAPLDVELEVLRKHSEHSITVGSGPRSISTPHRDTAATIAQPEQGYAGPRPSMQSMTSTPSVFSLQWIFDTTHPPPTSTVLATHSLSSPPSRNSRSPRPPQTPDQLQVQRPGNSTPGDREDDNSDWNQRRCQCASPV